MPPYVMALVFGALGLIAAWAIRRDLRSGWLMDGIYTVRRDDNPLWFAGMIVFKVGVVCFGVAEILFACGLIGDPFLAIKAALPFSGAVAR
jgi:hypothetical protein